MGAPIASHNESKRQIWEKDFSPPDSVFVALSPLPLWASSGWTYQLLA